MAQTGTVAFMVIVALSVCAAVQAGNETIKITLTPSNLTSLNVLAVKVLDEWCKCEGNITCMNQQATIFDGMLHHAVDRVDVPLYKGYYKTLQGTKGCEEIIGFLKPMEALPIPTSDPTEASTPEANATTINNKTDAETAKPEGEKTDQTERSPQTSEMPTIPNQSGAKVTTVTDSTLGLTTPTMPTELTGQALGPVTNSNTSTPAPSNSTEGTTHLYWSIPIITIALLAMIIGGLYIHRYAKRAGFRQSTKTEGSKINGSNSGNDGV